MKFSKYNFDFEDNGILYLYNSKNAAFVKMAKEDDKKSFNTLCESELSLDNPMVKALYNRGYIVDDDIDEYKEVQKNIKKIYSDRDKCLNLMIYATEQCNFRCVYCCEEHVNKKLSDENWENILKFIDKRIEQDKICVVRISFFGGEPLLESKKILDFSRKLNDLKKKYKKLIIDNNITTNGYLLTPKLYDELVKLNLLTYQITVDGFAKTHNQMRPRVDGEGTWDKIIENLKYINSKKDKASIIVRSNFNATNGDTVIEFVNWARKTFKSEKMMFMAHPVVKFSDNVTEDQLADKSKIKNILAETDYEDRSINQYNNPLSNLGYTCKCSIKNYYVIKVNGRVSKCEQAYSGTFDIGYLDENGIHFEMDESLWNEGYETENCKDCYIYPLCAARACPVKKVFDPERKDCKLNKLKDGESVTDSIKEAITAGAFDMSKSKVIKKVNPKEKRKN